MDKVVKIPGTGGWFDTEVVGESHYADELTLLVGSEIEVQFTAELVPEPSNPFDSNAVGVYRLGHGKVGHLSADLAKDWQPVLIEFEQRFAARVACEATAGRNPGGPIGVRVNVTLEDIKKEIGSRPAAMPGAVWSLQSTPSGWGIRRGAEVWPARTAQEIEDFVRQGRVLPSDYVFNPVLGQWMYARDTAELTHVFAELTASRTTSKTGLGLFLGGLIIGWVVWWPIGIIISIVAIFVILAHALRRSGASASASSLHRSENMTPPDSSISLIGWMLLAAAGIMIVAISIATYSTRHNGDDSAFDIRESRPAPSPATAVDPVITEVFDRSTAADGAREDLPIAAAHQAIAEIKRELSGLSSAEPVYAYNGFYYRENCQKPRAAHRLTKWVAERQGYREGPCKPVDIPTNVKPQPNVPLSVAAPSSDSVRRSSTTLLNERVYVSDGMYYREDCGRPAGAVQLSKSVAVREGNRPAPDCYQRVP